MSAALQGAVPDRRARCSDFAHASPVWIAVLAGQNCISYPPRRPGRQEFSREKPPDDSRVIRPHFGDRPRALSRTAATDWLAGRRDGRSPISTPDLHTGVRAVLMITATEGGPARWVGEGCMRRSARWPHTMRKMRDMRTGRPQHPISSALDAIRRQGNLARPSRPPRSASARAITE